MASGYNQVILIGNVKPNITIKPYRNDVKVWFYLEVEDLDYDPVYAKYRRHKELIRITFVGDRSIPFDFLLRQHKYIQVTGKLHIRTFKERMIGDKYVPCEIKTSPKNILLLDNRNNGFELTSFGAF